jgi:hypothetical protein
MRRRDFVKGIVAVPIASEAIFLSWPAPAEAEAAKPLAAMAEAEKAAMGPSLSYDYHTQTMASTVPDIYAVTQVHFFTAEQMATLRKLGNVFMPALDGYPGAVEAKVPEFLDFMIGSSAADRKHMYTWGLDRLNAECGKQFGVPFKDADAEQADKLLRPWLRASMDGHLPHEPYVLFINRTHKEIRYATMNSMEWSKAATANGEREPGVGQYWSPIDPMTPNYI